MKRFLLIIFFAAAVLSHPVFADEVPKPTGWVNDFAGVISGEYRDKMTAIIEKLRDKTAAEIFVVTVSSIAPHDERSYARMLFDSWKPGKKGMDNGVLVLLAVKERRWRIETGYGVEGTLPDGKCGYIGRTYMVPYFKSGKYGEGLYKGVSAIADVIARKSNAAISGLDLSGPKGFTGTSAVSPVLCFILIIFFFVWNLPWPVFIGLPVTLLFAAVFYAESPVYAVCIILGYIISQIIRYNWWKDQPPHKRGNFFGGQNYGTTGSSGGWGGGGGFGGGGFGGGGGGCGGGGGAGGGF